MSATHPEFNLDRTVSIQNKVDAEGRKWEIHSSRQYPGLVWVRPNPDREDAIIPKQMYGKWTSKDRLSKQMDAYLETSWTKAEQAKAKLERQNQAAKELAAKENKEAIEQVQKQEEEAPKQTEAESLEALDEDIKDFLGDTIALKEEVDPPKEKVAKKPAKKAAKKKVTKRA